MGAKHSLMDVETKEIVAVGQLHFTLAWQWITAWGFRCASSCTAVLPGLHACQAAEACLGGLASMLHASRLCCADWPLSRAG